MRIYESRDGQWIVKTDYDKLYFETKMEALQTMSNIESARALIGAVQTTSHAVDNAADLEAEHFAVGNDAMSAEELSALGIDQATLDACVTFLKQLGNFASNAAVTTGDYRTTLNKVRRLAT